MSQKGRTFSITINNPKISSDEYLSIAKAAGFTYAKFQLERGESGTPHIQGTVGGKQCRLPKLSKLFNGHVEVARNALALWDYCSKPETQLEPPVSYGVPPAQLNTKGDKGKRNKLLLEKGAEKAVEDGDIRLEQYVKVKHAIDLYRSVTSTPAALDNLQNIWYYGPPGTGKSHKVRSDFTEHYDKPLNKWWCDYKSQPTVILDDFGQEHSVLGSHLKRWADKYPFTAETKGGATTLRPERILVTSNYHPNEIWSDQMMLDAIQRRFTIVHKTER